MSGDVSTGQLGWVQDGPYFAYLSGEEYGRTISEGFGGLETDVLLGQLEIDASGNWANVSISFTLPDDVPPGEYWVTACNSPCRIGFGDLIGSTLYVGVDPPADEEGASATPAVVAADADNTERVATGLALAKHPARATGLDATWVAISAAFGLVVLLLVSVVRTKGS